MAGLLGALFGTLISGIVYNQLQNVVAGSATTGSLSSQLQLLPTSRIVGIMLVLNIATGVILSMTASFLALRRHVKV